MLAGVIIGAGEGQLDITMVGGFCVMEPLCDRPCLLYRYR